MPRATERVGRSGEYLTAALLSQVSDTVLVVPHGSEADIVFEHENKLYKVQVKTSSKINKGRVNWRFDMRRGSHSRDRQYQQRNFGVLNMIIVDNINTQQAIDIFALVCLKYRNAVFIKPIEIPTSKPNNHSRRTHEE